MQEERFRLPLGARPPCPEAIEAVWGQQLPAPSSMKGKNLEVKAPGLQSALPAVSPSTIKSLFYCNRATSALSPCSLRPFFLSIFLSDSAKQCLHSRGQALVLADGQHH